MKKLILILGLLITNSAQASGVYGTFYDNSDLEVKRSQLTAEQLKEINEAKKAKEKVERLEREEAQRRADEEWAEKMNKLKR